MCEWRECEFAGEPFSVPVENAATARPMRWCLLPGRRVVTLDGCSACPVPAKDELIQKLAQALRVVRSHQPTEHVAVEKCHICQDYISVALAAAEAVKEKP